MERHREILVNLRVLTGLKPKIWIGFVLRKYFLSQILMDTLHEPSTGRYNVFGYFFSLGGSNMFSLVLAVGMVIDLPIRKGSSCANGQCSAPAVQVEKKVEKTIKIESVKTDVSVFRGGKLRFSLRGSSCCGR
jgi:hypothetical protein